MGEQAVDVATDRRLVVGSGIGGIHPIDGEPAVLVERHTHGVHPPRGDRGDRSIVGWTVEDSPALSARILAAGAVDARDTQRCTRAVDELAPGYGDTGRRGGDG